MVHVIPLFVPGQNQGRGSAACQKADPNEHDIYYVEIMRIAVSLRDCLLDNSEIVTKRYNTCKCNIIGMYRMLYFYQKKMC